MLDERKLKHHLERVGDATSVRFWAECAALFSYIDKGASPANDVRERYEAERKTKWSTWGPTEPNHGRWSMPDDPEDHPSLAWDLFRAEAERKEDTSRTSNGLVAAMYHFEKYTEPVDRFREDFLQLLVDAVQAVLDAEGPQAADAREKHQKFGILDSPTLEAEDLRASAGILGRGFLFIDLDHFKPLNSRFTEHRVDDLVLRPLHRLIVACLSGFGFAYGKGGDETTALLPNASEEMTIAFAKAIHQQIAYLRLDADASDVRLQATIGVAWQPPGGAGADLPQLANTAENFAKRKGRNCIAIARGDGCEVVHRGVTAPPVLGS